MEFKNPFKLKPETLQLPAPVNNNPIKIPEAKYTTLTKIRQAIFTMVFGKKGIGKTFTTKKKEKKYLSGDLNKGTTPRKVLFFDIQRERADLKSIPVDYAFGFENENGIVVNSKTGKPIINWISIFSSNRSKIEARRILPVKNDGQPMSIEELNIVLAYVLKYFKGGLLVVEDIARYVSDSVTRDLTGSLASIRHANCDCRVIFQWKKKGLNPKLWGNVNRLELHKTTDSFKKYKSDLDGSEEMLFLAEILEKQENKKLKLNATAEQLKKVKEIPIEIFYVDVDMDFDKICGNFSPNDFCDAARKYILQNRKDALIELSSEVDAKSGKPKYTFEQQVKMKTEELFRNYYGNE